MKVAVIHGQSHHGNTYQVTHLLLDKLNCTAEEVKEFDVNQISSCVGCFQCILKDEKKCPHRLQIEPILEAMDEADVIIMASPNYVMGMTGQMKSFCDHLAYRFMSHRPNADMKKKIGIAISTTAGAGANQVTKAIKEQFFWGSVGKSYALPVIVSAFSLEEMKPEKKQKLTKQIKRLANQVNANAFKVKPGLKTNMMFGIMRSMQSGMSYNPVDTMYWKEKGWIK